MKTQKQVRESFWNAFPEFKSEYKKTYTQNQYRCDIRCYFVNYVDNLAKNGEISEKLAQRVTL